MFGREMSGKMQMTKTSCSKSTPCQGCPRPASIRKRPPRRGFPSRNFAIGWSGWRPCGEVAHELVLVQKGALQKRPRTAKNQCSADQDPHPLRFKPADQTDRLGLGRGFYLIGA